MGASFSLEDGENGERMEESASRLLIHSELTQEYKDATHAVIAECFDELVVTFGGGLLTKFTLNEEEFDLVRRRGVFTVEQKRQQSSARRSSPSSSRIPGSTSSSGRPRTTTRTARRTGPWPTSSTSSARSSC
jgi:hypothetical protein